MKDFYTYGSEAYAPISIEMPSHLPEEPKKDEPLIVEEKKSVSLLTVIGAGVVLIAFLGLLVSMIQLFEIRSERAELQRQIQQLQTEQKRLTAQYESTIDIEAIAKRAEELGMHIPYIEQIRYTHIEKSEGSTETVQTEENEKDGPSAP